MFRELVAKPAVSNSRLNAVRCRSLDTLEASILTAFETNVVRSPKSRRPSRQRAEHFMRKLPRTSWSSELCFGPQLC